VAVPFAGTSRFQVVERLGEGGFGVVYLVRDQADGSEVALKTFPVARPEYIYRLKREFRAVADLRHENLVSFYELFADEERVFFTMEYVKGLHLRRWVRPGGALDERRLRTAIGQLARGLDAIHRAGTLHRDVKPSNVLVTPEERVVILDFGLAAEIEECAGGRGAEAAGTPQYMSPEQSAGGAPLSPASDWYSVGVILYQALTGVLPARAGPTGRDAPEPRAPSPAALVPGLPPDLCELCGALLSDDPARRPGAAEVAAVAGPPARPSAPPQPVAPAATFVGREAELRLLGDALDGVRDGQAVTVLVEGAPGVGKTTVIDRFLSDAQVTDGATVLRGRCYERERVPYQGIDSLVDELCGLLRVADATTVAELLPQPLGALARLFPVLGRVPAIAEGAEPGAAGLDAQELRSRAFATFRELLRRIAGRRPLILHVDDLQWGDLDTAALFHDVLRPPDSPPLLLVLSYRGEERERSPFLRALAPARLGRVVRVEVGPLDRAAGEALARRLLAASGSEPDADAGRIADEAGGNPLFIQELVGFAVRDPGGAGASRGSDLSSAISARIDRLPARARQLLELVAVAGHPVPERTVRSAAGLAWPAWDVWHALEQGHLVRFGSAHDGRVVEPYHDRIREAAVAALPPSRAVALHAGLARALEKRADADPEVLARHHEAAGAVDRARDLAAIAARQAEGALAFDRAARLFRWALELTPSGDPARAGLLASLGLALANGGRGVEAARAYADAAELVPEEIRGELRRRAAEQLLLSGRIDEGRELVADDLRAAGFAIPRTPWRALVSLLAGRAVLRWRGLSFTPRPEAEVPARDLALLDHLWAVTRALALVDVVRGSDFTVRLLLAALRCGEPVRVLRGAVLAAGHAAAEAPRSPRTDTLLREVEAQARALGTPAARAYVLFVRSIRCYMSSAFAPAAEAADAAERAFRETCAGTVWETWSSRLFAGYSLFYLGRWRELARRTDEQLDEARRRGNAFAVTTAGTPFGIVPLLARGDAAGGRAILSEAMAGWSSAGFHIQHYWFMIAGCFLDLHAGDGAAAWARLRAAWPGLTRALVRRMPLARVQSYHLRGCCAIAAAAGARGLRRRALLGEGLRAARRLERVRLPIAAPLAAMLRAGVAALAWKGNAAARLLSRAARELDSQQVASYAAVARWQLATVTGSAPPPFLPGEGVGDPAGIARMLAPGFPER
jgi:predicted Ser/Thr protein kinase